MSKITYENKKGKITIINRLSYPENVNERLYNTIVSGKIEGFLPMSVMQKGNDIRIECVIQGLIPLTEYFSGVITKKMFLDVTREIALQIKNCEKNMLNANNLDLQMDKIFVDSKTKSVKCIFWPIVNNQRANPPQLFLKQLPYELNFNSYENNDYLKTYNDFFSGTDPFSVNGFERMVLKLSGIASSVGYTTPSEVMSERFVGNKEPKKKSNIEYDPFAVKYEQKDEPNIELKNEPQNDVEIVQNKNFIFCLACGVKNKFGSNFCIKCGARIEDEDSEEPIVVRNQTEILNTPVIDMIQKEESFEPASNKVDDEECGTTILTNDFGGTSVLNSDGLQKQVQPYLVRLKTEESYLIDKPIFRIGSGQNKSDLYINNNNFISRNHADIITRNNRYYIVDRNSTNKTYINSNAIPGEKEVEIFSGTRIKLANEEFVFNINNR